MTNQSTVEQGRAAYAYKCATQGKTKGDEYKSYVKKLPMLIKTNGLGASMAFAFAKGSTNGQVTNDKTWRLIYNQIKEYLKNQSPNKIIELGSSEELAGKLTTINSFEYRAVTVDVLAFLNWLRRFADGLI